MIPPNPCAGSAAGQLPQLLPGPPRGACDADASQVSIFQGWCSNHGSWSWSICPSRGFLTLPVSWADSPFQTGLRLDRQEDGSGQHDVRGGEGSTGHGSPSLGRYQCRQ